MCETESVPSGCHVPNRLVSEHHVNVWSNANLLSISGVYLGGNGRGFHAFLGRVPGESFWYPAMAFRRLVHRGMRPLLRKYFSRAHDCSEWNPLLWKLSAVCDGTPSLVAQLIQDLTCPCLLVHPDSMQQRIDLKAVSYTLKRMCLYR